MNKRLVTVTTCVDSGAVAEESLEYLKQNSTPELTHIVLLDNGSYDPLVVYQADQLIRFPTNVGGNGVMHKMIPFLDEMNVEFVAYFHNDFMVAEKGWDSRVIAAFDNDPKLALLGMVGSDEMDGNGGRGFGTRLSFVGKEVYRTGWTGGPAEHHGKRSVGVQAAAGLDHCSLIFRLSALKEIPPQEGNYAPGHFYDRACCCELLQRGYRVATIDIACDHFSGGTGLCRAPGVHKGVINRNELYTKWLESQGINSNVPNVDVEVEVFKEAERLFIKKWRDELKFIPLRVEPDYSIIHL
jgi:GT2 family glycosyltransferase